VNGKRFDDLIRAVMATRRALLGGALASVVVGFGARGSDAAGKPRHKKRDKKPRPNAYGCLGVGAACKREGQCCSGICDGKKDKKTCRAHDVGTCNQKMPGYCEVGNPQLAVCDGDGCNCIRTTANSNFCANNVICADCKRDADCTALGFPAGSACAPLGGNLSCEGLCESGMACITPCGSVPPEM
jgi:hypothetical protein